MEFFYELERFLYGKGYRKIKTEQGSFWLLDAEDCLRMIEIRPETLPGQDRVPLRKQEEDSRQVENQCMIRFGKRVERLVLMLFRGFPNEAFVEELREYPNIWCVDKVNGKVLLFENQRTEYYGLRSPLEDFAAGYFRQEEVEKKRELRFLFSPVNTVLILINVLVFLALSLLGDVSDASFMAAHGAMMREAIVGGGEYYRLFTAMFLHFGLDHLLQNMLLLFLLGPRLERLTGSLTYTFIYFGAGVGASLASVFITLASEPYTVSAGASGAIFGVMGGLLFLVVKDVVQKRRKRIREIGLSGMLFMVLGSLSYGIGMAGIDNAAHLGGLAAGFLVTGILAFRK